MSKGKEQIKEKMRWALEILMDSSMSNNLDDPHPSKLRLLLDEVGALRDYSKKKPGPEWVACFNKWFDKNMEGGNL